MKATHRAIIAASAAACALWAGLALLAGDAAGKPMPVLRRDSSPVEDGRSGRVASYADVIEPVQKTVVSIYSTKLVRERVPMNPFLRQFFGGQVPDLERERKEEGLGSGVIVSPEGYILTNNHVVEGADELTVALSDNRKFTGKLVGADQKTDVAVVKIEASGLPAITFADSDKLRVGDIVFAVGNPLYVGETVTMGIVSAKGKQLGLLDDVGGYENFIQTDAAINLGNSGGALVDAKGRLVGINSAIVSPSRGSVGIGFAIPANLAASVMLDLIGTGTVTRGYMGTGTQDITPDIADQVGLPRDAKGVLVTDITAGGPADRAGLRTLDVILAVGDRPVNSTDELRFLIAAMAPGTRIVLRVVRGGKPLTINVALGKLVERPDELIAGVNAAPLTDAFREQLGIDARIYGLLVTKVADDSPFSDVIAPDMVIMEINRNPVADLSAARQLIQPGRNLLKVYNQGLIRFVGITVN